jgi:RNA polymerase sigma-70 factor (ECF subfamily)
MRPFRPLSDQELLALVRRDHPDAFAELVARYQRELYFFFRRFGGDASSAEDDVQETFLRVYKARGGYRPLVPFRAFLYTIARNLLRDRARYQRRRAAAVHRSAPRPAAAPDGDDWAERLDLRDAIAALPEAMRLVLVLSVYQGLSYEEISAVVGIPLGTVKTRMFHALRILRRSLAIDVGPASR